MAKMHLGLTMVKNIKIGNNMGHDENCNCEDCWWGRDCQEVCPTCGALVGAGCPDTCTTSEAE